jgi:hypothetical protein
MVGRERGKGEQTENKESPAIQGGTLVKRPVVVQGLGGYSPRGRWSHFPDTAAVRHLSRVPIQERVCIGPQQFLALILGRRFELVALKYRL